MINLYTDKNKIPEGWQLQQEIDLHFNWYLSCYDLDEEDYQIIEKVDKAVRRPNTSLGEHLITTPYGPTDCTHLSTGCKTFLLIKNAKEDDRYVYSLNECCVNVLDAILTYLAEYKHWLPVYLSFDTEIVGCNAEHCFTLNGSEKVFTLDQVERWFVMNGG